MAELTLNEVYEFLGIPTIYEQYLENGRLPRWTCSDSEKLDFKFGKPDFRDGKLIIKIPFSIEEIESQAAHERKVVKNHERLL